MAMEDILGKWKSVKGSSTNMDGVLDAINASEEIKNAAKNLDFVMTYSKDGTKLVVLTQCPSEEKLKDHTLSFNINEPFEFTDMFGEKMTNCISKWDGSKFVENCTDSKGHKFEVAREIKGNNMKVTVTVNGVSSSQDWEKC